MVSLIKRTIGREKELKFGEVVVAKTGMSVAWGA